MGKISEHDRRRTRKLIAIFPISIALLLLLLLITERSRIIENKFNVGYDGPFKPNPVITIISEEGIKSETARRELHKERSVVQIPKYEMEEETRDDGDPSHVPQLEEIVEPLEFDLDGENIYRSYPSHADVPYSENYKIINMVEPGYPPDALEMGLEGSVVVEVYVNEEGRVAEAWVRSSYGHKSFEDSSLVAIRRFVFKPSVRDEDPIPFWISFLVNFKQSQ